MMQNSEGFHSRWYVFMFRFNCFPKRSDYLLQQANDNCYSCKKCLWGNKEGQSQFVPFMLGIKKHPWLGKHIK